MLRSVSFSFPSSFANQCESNMDLALKLREQILMIPSFLLKFVRTRTCELAKNFDSYDWVINNEAFKKVHRMQVVLKMLGKKKDSALVDVKFFRRNERTAFFTSTFSVSAQDIVWVGHAQDPRFNDRW